MRCAGRKWLRALPWIFVLCIAAGCAAGLYVLRYEQPVYEAAYTICVLPGSEDSWQKMLMLERDCNALCGTSVFRQAVLEKTASDGKSTVDVKAQKGTHLLTLTAKGPDAAIVQGLANAAGEALVERISRMFDVASAQEVERAVLPETPCNAPLEERIALAVIIAFAAGSLLAMLFGSGQRRIRHDLPECEGFCLGAVADTRHEVKRFIRKKPENGMLLYRVDRLIRENIRRLILRLRQSEQRCLVLCGVQDEMESASATVLLASELAQQGYRVLLLEMDDTQPQLARLLNVKARADLHDYLLCRSEWNETVVRTAIPTLAFVDWLHDDVNVADLAATEAFGGFLQSARTHFDWVILHAAPAMDCTDTAMLSLVADGVVLLAQDGRYLLEDIEEAARQQARLGRAAKGVVFTGVRRERLETADQ